MPFTYSQAIGTIPEQNLPPLATIEYLPCADENAMLALTAQRGDVAIRSDLDNAWFVLVGDDSSVLANWEQRDSPIDTGDVLIEGWVRDTPPPSGTVNGDIWFERISGTTYLVMNDNGNEKAVALTALVR